MIQQTIITKSKSKRNKNYTPFPTLYWLTCPHVSRAISELERVGHVRNLQLKLANNDNTLAKEWWECHEEYAFERWNILSKYDQDWLLGKEDADVDEMKQRTSMRDMIQCSGVAGTDHRGLRKEGVEGEEGDSSFFVPSVKCLHSHYAHYRSQLSRRSTTNNGESDDVNNIKYNLVGKWTHELLLEHFPDIIL